MTVRDLIAELQKLPQDAQVGVEGADNGTMGSGYPYFRPAVGLRKVSFILLEDKLPNGAFVFVPGEFIY